MGLKTKLKGALPKMSLIAGVTLLSAFYTNFDVVPSTTGSHQIMKLSDGTPLGIVREDSTRLYNFPHYRSGGICDKMLFGDPALTPEQELAVKAERDAFVTKLRKQLSAQSQSLNSRLISAADTVDRLTQKNLDRTDLDSETKSHLEHLRKAAKAMAFTISKLGGYGDFFLQKSSRWAMVNYDSEKQTGYESRWASYSMAFPNVAIPGPGENEKLFTGIQLWRIEDLADVGQEEPDRATATIMKIEILENVESSLEAFERAFRVRLAQVLAKNFYPIEVKFPKDRRAKFESMPFETKLSWTDGSREGISLLGNFYYATYRIGAYNDNRESILHGINFARALSQEYYRKMSVTARAMNEFSISTDLVKYSDDSTQDWIEQYSTANFDARIRKWESRVNELAQALEGIFSTTSPNLSQLMASNDYVPEPAPLEATFKYMNYTATGDISIFIQKWKTLDREVAQSYDLRKFLASANTSTNRRILKEFLTGQAGLLTDTPARLDTYSDYTRVAYNDFPTANLIAGAALVRSDSEIDWDKFYAMREAQMRLNSIYAFRSLRDTESDCQKVKAVENASDAFMKSLGLGEHTLRKTYDIFGIREEKLR